MTSSSMLFYYIPYCLTMQIQHPKEVTDFFKIQISELPNRLHWFWHTELYDYSLYWPCDNVSKLKSGFSVHQMILIELSCLNVYDQYYTFCTAPKFAQMMHHDYTPSLISVRKWCLPPFDHLLGQPLCLLGLNISTKHITATNHRVFYIRWLLNATISN